MKLSWNSKSGVDDKKGLLRVVKVAERILLIAVAIGVLFVVFQRCGHREKADQSIKVATPRLNSPGP
jgi:hypothetical protein